MSKGRKHFLLIGIGIIVVTACFLTWRSQRTNNNPIIVLSNGATVQVTIADTDDERQQGLSGMPSLQHNHGMLFIFDQSDVYRFWMKDMLFPIDIIWIDSDWRVIDITENISPDTYPELFSPQSPAQHVLEVPAGNTKQLNIVIGDQLELLQNL